ncbi:MAG: V-type ATP synthase subunit A [Candidatus Helarchaeota archaeon]
MAQGKVIWVSGPLIKGYGEELRNTKMHEIVGVGPEKLIGEIIKLENDVIYVQVYEETSGLKPGDTIITTDKPLSVTLGPGLLGSVFDGIQRPLPQIMEAMGAFIKRGATTEPLSSKKKWHFKPLLKNEDRVSGGDIIGTVLENDFFEHRIMIPPGIEGKVEWVTVEGEYTIKDEILRLRGTSGSTFGISSQSSVINLGLTHDWPVRTPRPFKRRLLNDKLLITGHRVIDTFFPITYGGAAAIPGGFGSGKTVTLQSLAKWVAADVIIYIGCGERGNEMAEILEEFPSLTDPKTGRHLMDRMILIANTSNMPVSAREASIYTGITMAEYYRDMGYDVALMADSTSRWAEALRELSGRLDEIPAERGYPSYLPSRLAEFYERAGNVVVMRSGGEEQTGSVTAIGAVSPPSSDFSDPVVVNTKKLIEVFWALDKDLAYARHYPAINWTQSYSENILQVAEWWQDNISSDWKEYHDKAISILQKTNELKRIVKLIGMEALPDSQRLILRVGDMIKDGFLNQNAYDPVDCHSPPEKQYKMLKLIIDFYDFTQKRLIENRVPIYRVISLPFIIELEKMKSTIPNDDLDLIEDLRNKVFEELGDIERERVELEIKKRKFYDATGSEL